MVAELAPLYDAKPMNRGSSGAIISGTEALDGLNFNPYYWAGALYAQRGNAVLLNASWSYEPIALFAPKEAHPWDDIGSPQKIRQILLDSRVAVSPQIAFLCGGKWDPSKEIEPAYALAHQRGLIRVFDSKVYYCYGREIAAPVERAQRKPSGVASR